jgi:N-acetylmuramoyl-L-alanine amidase
MPPSPGRLKRRILREAVRENVEALRGRPPRTLRPGYRLARGILQAAGLGLLPALALVAFQGGSGPPERAADPGRPLLATFPAPRPIAPVVAPLEVRKIVLDPGHGGSDPGAAAGPGVWEKDLVLDVARQLRALLREATYEVALTREDDVFVSLRERARIANAERADVFVSIHLNSVPSGDCQAVETYYLGPPDDARAEELAGQENRDAGYPLADFRRLLEGVYVQVRQAESQKLAQAVQQELVTALANTNPAIRDRGVRSAPFLVLVATESPGILAEVSCLANEAEAARLADPEHRRRIARALFLGIHAYAEARSRVATLGRAQGARR